VLVKELEQIGASSIQSADGGVKFQGDLMTCYRTNLQSRIASRVLWQIASQPYRGEEDIYKTTHGLPWTDWFKPSLTIRVNVSAIKCPLRSLDFVTLKIKDALCDKFREATGKRPSVDTAEPDIRIHAFLDAHRFTLYLDTSGEALFKRGLRKASGEAPLRENLAAGILHLSGWKPGIPLIDPMCGSGTFLLEAAQIALNIAPGSQRGFAFEKLNHFDREGWTRLKRDATDQVRPHTPQPIFGSDLYGDALSDARTNLVAAGLSDLVNLKQANFAEVSSPEPSGVLVTNPPYGVRIGDQQQLEDLYPLLGDTLKKRFTGWNAYILTADPMLPKLIRLTASRRTPLFNGALECRLLEYKMVSGGMRKVRPGDDKKSPETGQNEVPL
jgi:putative N6-adenine-specific DNA methylase